VDTSSSCSSSSMNSSSSSSVTKTNYIMMAATRGKSRWRKCLSPCLSPTWA
jgi:ABC-type antimicrobial peptide transport system permease subunit